MAVRRYLYKCDWGHRAFLQQVSQIRVSELWQCKWYFEPSVTKVKGQGSLSGSYW